MLRAAVITYREFVGYMVEAIKMLSHLREKDLYPEIEPTTVLLSHSSLKIKLRAGNIESSERETLREFGYYFSSLLRSLCNAQSQTPSSGAHRLVGLTIGKRLDLESLLGQLIKTE